MNCDICQRPHHATRLPFLCAVDARNRCYQGRVQLLQVVLENEGLQRRINDLVVVTGEIDVGGEPGFWFSTPAAKRIALESSASRQSLAEDRTHLILAQAERLRRDIAAAQEEIKVKRDLNARRRSDLVTASNGIDGRRARAQDGAERSVASLQNQWDRSADRMAATRAFLCMEAAKLYGLRRIKRGSSRYEFKLGGIDVVDLASMNASSPEHITTSLAHVAHILILASHYLAIRLPAEITMPHRDYPRPTIFNLASSYQHGGSDGRLSGLDNGFLELGGHGNGREMVNVSRPRPLSLDRPLAALAKDDPSAYSFFLEGVTLLAYDVAWACLTQNVPIGDRGSFDDVCNMGRNLYNLLIGQQLHNNQTTRMFPSTSVLSGDASDGDEPVKSKPPAATPMMGRYSHGSTRTSLGNSAGTEFIRSFKLPAPIKLADKLKKKLTTEGSVPEWEILENGDWEVDDGL